MDPIHSSSHMLFEFKFLPAKLTSRCQLWISSRQIDRVTRVVSQIRRHLYYRHRTPTGAADAYDDVHYFACRPPQYQYLWYRHQNINQPEVRMEVKIAKIFVQLYNEALPFTIYDRITMMKEIQVCGSRKRRRRSRGYAWACHQYCFDCPIYRIRRNAIFFCTLMCTMRYCMALVSIPSSSRGWANCSTSKSGCNVLRHQRLLKAGIISSSSGINLLTFITALNSKILPGDDFDNELNEDEFSNTDKGNVDDDDKIGAEEYFGRFISEALEGENTEIPPSPKKPSSPAMNDDNILLETKRMIEQQQQQIDLLLKLMNNQGRQQLPPLPASTTKRNENRNDESHTTPIFPSTLSKQQQSKIVPPLKAMLFIDGTWLYYSLNTRNPKTDAIVSKFGKGWQNNYKVDW